MQLIAELNLSHVNLRREKQGEDDGPIACDLKFSGDAKPEELKGLFTTDAQYRRLLAERWDVDNDPTVTDSTSIPLEVKAVGCTIELSAALGAAGKLRWTDGNVDRIDLDVKPGRTVGVKMRVQVRPTKEQIAQLAEWYSCDLNLSVWTRQHDLDLGSPAGKTDAAADSKAKPLSAKADDDENAPIVPGQKPPQRPKRSAAKAH